MGDSDKFNRACARAGRDSLIVTAILTVIIVGGLLLTAIKLYTEQVAAWKVAKVSMPMAITESDFIALLVIIAGCIVFAIVAWLILFESNNRHWGI